MAFRCSKIALLIGLAALWPVSIRGGDPPAAAPAADGQRIDRLIRQLGGDDFEERESASQALARIGGPALDALRKAASTGPDAETRQRAVALVSGIENSLDQLLAYYRRFGLPLPPAGAPLVRFEEQGTITSSSTDNQGRTETKVIPPHYAFAFLIEPAAKDRPANLLYGTETWYRWGGNSVGPALEPQQLTADFLKANLPDPPKALALALQMHARGWDGDQIVFDQGFRQTGKHGPRNELRLLAWKYWDGRLQDEADETWSAAARQMKALLADEPDLDTPENRALLKSLEAALAPSNAKPGSVDALIDSLMKARSTNLFEDILTGPPDEHFCRVFDLGFEAVPVLLEHLDDNRLTRYLEAPGEFPGLVYYHYRVGDMASLLLRGIAGQRASRKWPYDRDDRTGEKRSAQEWWEKAREQSEEAYLAANVLPAGRKGDPEDDEEPEIDQVRILGKKYPRRLAGIYRDVLKNHRLNESRRLAEALAGSSLPRKDKVELFVLAAGDKDLEYKNAALAQLKDLDSEQFVSLLTSALDHLPRTPDAPYGFCREADFTELVCTTADPRAWRALERAARRSDVGLRLDMLNRTYDPDATAAQRRLRLAFLASFLDDDEVRDADGNKEMFGGTYAGDGFRRLEVRNFAAMRISDLLGTPADPTPNWRPEQWAKLREQMRAVVQRELGDGPKK